jgi:hypothetical protein
VAVTLPLSVTEPVCPPVTKTADPVFALCVIEPE